MQTISRQRFFSILASRSKNSESKSRLGSAFTLFNAVRYRRRCDAASSTRLVVRKGIQSISFTLQKQYTNMAFNLTLRKLLQKNSVNTILNDLIKENIP